MRVRLLAIAVLIVFVPPGFASVFGTVRVIAHDQQHRPIAQGKVTLHSRTSDWQQTEVTDDEGVAHFVTVPVGDYSVLVAAPGFDPQTLTIAAISGRVQELHVRLQVASVRQNVVVTAEPSLIDSTSSTPQDSVDRELISRVPGADRTNSLSFITDFVPGATIVHDQLHVRGGHQVSWALDGVPLPNTNIASNVGPQFDPKDADYVEEQRGTYSAEYGDRTYGVFNVVPRSGFERQRQAELVLSYGSYHATDDQLSFGDHSQRGAYYASLSGNRSEYGLEPPTPQRLHDAESGGSAFTSEQFNLGAADQLRFVAAFRKDFYQVPNDADAQLAGVRDREREHDALAVFTYAHTFGPATLLTVSPFFHFNRAAFEGGPQDAPIANDDRASTYGGGQLTLVASRGKHNLKTGLYAFMQRDEHRFRLIANRGSGSAIAQRADPAGALTSFYLEDQYRPLDWLTFNLGLRASHFSGGVVEDSADPRLGVALTLPRLRWVLRAAYARYYQAPPLSTLSGPLLRFALAQGVGFLPLRGERDEQQNFGITVPVDGWAFDLDYFRTGARNFFDHTVLGDSNIFFPLTIAHARTRGVEVAVRSPRSIKKVDVHLAFSHQSAEAGGAVSGGLTDFSPPPDGFFYLDHDQRNTLSTGASFELPWRSWTSANLSFGSGFLDGNGPGHLPDHYALDIALGRSFGEKWSAKLTATNVTGQRFFIDHSNTFGGSHVSDPRQLSLQVRYRFHY